MRSVVFEMVMIDMHYYNNVVIFLRKTTFNTTIFLGKHHDFNIHCTISVDDCNSVIDYRSC